MMPGLHPGLLLARTILTFEDVPQEIYISTTGAPVTRTIGLSLPVRGGVGPYTYSWAVTAGIYTPSPSNGSGTTASAPVGFSTSVAVANEVSSYAVVGTATLTVTDARGQVAEVQVEVAVGQ